MLGGFGPGFLTTPSGTFCDARCFSDGLTASQFKKIGTTLSTFACGVSGDSGVVSGYQLSNGTATCSVASGNSVSDSKDYTCLCQVSFPVLSILEQRCSRRWFQLPPIIPYTCVTCSAPFLSVVLYY